MNKQTLLCLVIFSCFFLTNSMSLKRSQPKIGCQQLWEIIKNGEGGMLNNFTFQMIPVFKIVVFWGNQWYWGNNFYFIFRLLRQRFWVSDTWYVFEMPKRQKIAWLVKATFSHLWFNPLFVFEISSVVICWQTISDRVWTITCDSCITFEKMSQRQHKSLSEIQLPCYIVLHSSWSVDEIGWLCLEEQIQSWNRNPAQNLRRLSSVGGGHPI